MGCVGVPWGVREGSSARIGVPQPKTTGRLDGRARALALRAAGALNARDLCALSERGHGHSPACHSHGVGSRDGDMGKE